MNLLENEMNRAKTVMNNVGAWERGSFTLLRSTLDAPTLHAPGGCR
jgi:hypothetical protein